MAVFGRKQQQGPAEIDLRDRPPAEKFGYPTPCPECGANGYLDSIDVTEHTMYQHCPTCWAKWTTAEHELTGSR